MSGPKRHDADPDAEKATAAYFEPKLGASAVVDQTVERSVVRKLDHRIVPLVAFLCKSSLPRLPSLSAHPYRRPGQVVWDFQLTNGQSRTGSPLVVSR